MKRKTHREKMDDVIEFMEEHIFHPDASYRKGIADAIQTISIVMGWNSVSVRRVLETAIRIRKDT